MQLPFPTVVPMQNGPMSSPAPRPSLKTVLGAWLHPRTWASLAHLSVGALVTTVTFILVVTAVSLSVGLLFALLIGVPFLGLTLLMTQALGAFDRARYRLFFGEDIGSPHVPVKGSAWVWFKKRALSGAAWREVLWFLLTWPLTLAAFVIVTSVAAWSVALVALPAYIGRLPNDSASVGRIRIHQGSSFAAAIFGLLGLILVPWMARGWTALDVTMARFMLGPNAKTAALQSRVENLTVTRAATVDAADAERRRIERDLHDGAQQRLVALAMSLGMASDKMDSDPAEAKLMVADAHQEAKKAVAELRDLARGIHPVSLSDRGLAGALPGLAARCPVPVEVSVDIKDRPLPAIEGIAYFVVSECLTNIVKHANATKGWVKAKRSGDRLIVEIRDNGIGGTVVKPGGGLSGLKDRVASVDGTLSVFSAPAGSTTVTAMLPCGSTASRPAQGGVA
jgi:signal transduction histidine kinase